MNFINSFKNIPFYCYLMIIASTIIIVGIEWDISWHESIGRDTFWSPPHMAIYSGGILAGLIASYIIFTQTFGKNNLATVNFWGFKGPMSCWVTIWGTIAMLTSAPFDDWWHNAYGLDVQILSPPHIVLAMGIWAIIFGSLLAILSEKNKSNNDNNFGYDTLYLYTSSLVVLMITILLTEKSFLNLQHTMEFYTSSLILLPVFLFAIIRPSKYKWTFTIIALFYMLHRCILIWSLPLFDAEPMLTPIRRNIDHFVVPPFPIFLIIPGFFIDLIRHYLKDIKFLIKNIIYGFSFVVIFFITHWYTSILLLSNFGRNWFFGSGKTFPYFVPDFYKDLSGEHGDELFFKSGDQIIDKSGNFIDFINSGNFEKNDYLFWFIDRTPYGDTIILEHVNFEGLFFTVIFCILSCMMGSFIGNWLKRVKR